MALQSELFELLYKEVENAIQEGNPPFAAIIIDERNTILAITHNKSNTKLLAIAHAEIEAIQVACKTRRLKKLENCTLYVNAEPCAMCSGAIIKSGIKKVVYAASYEEGSNPEIYLREINEKASPKLNIQGGVMEEIFSAQIKKGRNEIKLQNKKRR